MSKYRLKIISFAETCIGWDAKFYRRMRPFTRKFKVGVTAYRVGTFVPARGQRKTIMNVRKIKQKRRAAAQRLFVFRPTPPG